MRLKKIVREVVREVAEEEGIPEDGVWRILCRIRERIDR